MYDIVITNFSLRFENTIVFNDFSLKIKQGETVCVIGPSGCGKSSLLKSIIGVISSYDGTIDINNKRKNKYLGGGIAYIQQNPNLLPWRSLLQNACLGAELREELDETIINRVNDQVIEFGLNGFQNCKPEELSGGMQQRTALISALESRPDILLCDEPFNSVDFVTCLDLMTKFRNHCKLAKRTTLFVTHNIEEAIFLADRIIILSKRPARIIEEFEIHLTEHRDNAVLARKSEEFNNTLVEIWKILNDNAKEEN